MESVGTFVNRVKTYLANIFYTLAYVLFSSRKVEELTSAIDTDTVRTSNKH